MATSEPGGGARVWARRIKQAAHGVAQESTVATILAVPEADRNGFTAGRARAVGEDAAIESVVESLRGMLAGLATLTEASPTGYGVGWNAARARALSEVDGVRAALVAERARGYRTQAAPESLLHVSEFVEALYHIWAVVDWRECRWDIGTERCTVHPRHSGSPHRCDFGDAAEFVRRMGLDPGTDAVPELFDEVRKRREPGTGVS